MTERFQGVRIVKADQERLSHLEMQIDLVGRPHGGWKLGKKPDSEAQEIYHLATTGLSELAFGAHTAKIERLL